MRPKRATARGSMGDLHDGEHKTASDGATLAHVSVWHMAGYEGGA